MLLAKDIMRRKVVSLKPEMSLREAAGLLTKHRITGAPVLDRSGGVIGVVSQTDLLKRAADYFPNGSAGFHLDQEEDLRAPASTPDVPDQTQVEQIMTREVISFEEDTPIVELARQMLLRRVHRVIITRKGALAGIVTTMDMIGAVWA